jgi:ATP-dependent RNA helicase RhlE
MNQNSNRGNAPRHPRSPLPKHQPSGASQRRAQSQSNNQPPRPPQQSQQSRSNSSGSSPKPPGQGRRRNFSSSPSALFATPPKQARNWLDDATHRSRDVEQTEPKSPRDLQHKSRETNAAFPSQNFPPKKNQHQKLLPRANARSVEENTLSKNNKNGSNDQIYGENVVNAGMKVPVSSASAPMHVRAAAPAPAREPATEDHGFAALGLRDELVRAVLAHGYSTPTPIQKQGIPAVLDGGDLLGGAQTGTGKTAGFVLPMLQRLNAKPATKRGNATLPRALILAPTRELAAQVEESVRVYGKFLPLTSTVIFGGVNINPQITTMRRGVDIVVATPGRLLDLHQQRAIDLSAIEILVLDEADRMLDMGFIHDIKKVLAVLPPKRQNLLFSATFSDDIKALADRLLNNPRMIEVARRNTTVEVVDQSVVLVDKAYKAKLLIHLVKERQWFQVLVFTRTKHGANRLAEQLSKSGIPAMAIHGNKSQSARMKALAEFKSNTLQVLVATDIAARGIDIDQLPHVVNYELPNVPEDYVHRIGRTGRAGATGEAMSLVMKDELPLLKDIEKFTKQSIPKITIEGFNPAAIPEPSAPSSDARDAEFQKNGGRPPSRGRPSSNNRSAPRGGRR